MSKVGIFSGTFDPIHKGHVAFALEAIEAAGLDTVLFMPEAKPRRKSGVTHYAHRVAMLKLALKPYKKLDILEVNDNQFSVTKTMPKLLKKFEGDELYLLIGSDAVPYLADLKHWPNAQKMLKNISLIVGLRSNDQSSDIKKQLMQLETSGHKAIIVESPHRHASSGEVRSSVSKRVKHHAALQSTKKYISKNWLYESVTDSGTKS